MMTAAVGRTTAITRIILTVVVVVVTLPSFGSNVTYGSRPGSQPALPSDIAESPASVIECDSWSTAGTGRSLAIVSRWQGESRLNKAVNEKSKSVSRLQGPRWKSKRKSHRNYALRERMRRERERMEKNRLDRRRLDMKRMDNRQKKEERTRTSKKGTEDGRRDESVKMAGDRRENAANNGMSLRKNQRFPGNEIIINIDGRPNYLSSLFAASPSSSRSSVPPPPSSSSSSLSSPPSPSSVPSSISQPSSPSSAYIADTVSKTVTVENQERVVVGITQAARSVVFVTLITTSIAVIAVLCRDLRSSPSVAASSPKPVWVLPRILSTVFASPLPAKQVQLVYDVV